MRFTGALKIHLLGESGGLGKYGDKWGCCPVSSCVAFWDYLLRPWNPPSSCVRGKQEELERSGEPATCAEDAEQARHVYLGIPGVCSAFRSRIPT